MNTIEAATRLGNDWDNARVRRQIRKGNLTATQQQNGRYDIADDAFSELERWSKAKSKTEWRRQGRRIRKAEEPIGTKSCRTGNGAAVWHVFAEDQTEPIHRKQLRPPVVLPKTPENILAAIFTVNRSAKRFRDAASSLYAKARGGDRSLHGFVRQNKEKKNKLYRLKDRGIIYAFGQGWIRCEGVHGSLTLYRGCGYCFHSLLRPKKLDIEETGDVALFIESKPKDKGELRLKDAEATLKQLDVDEKGFQRMNLPRFSRPSRHAHRHQIDEWSDEDDWDDDGDDNEENVT